MTEIVILVIRNVLFGLTLCAIAINVVGAESASRPFSFDRDFGQYFTSQVAELEEYYVLELSTLCHSRDFVRDEPTAYLTPTFLIYDSASTNVDGFFDPFSRFSSDSLTLVHELLTYGTSFYFQFVIKKSLVSRSALRVAPSFTENHSETYAITFETLIEQSEISSAIESSEAQISLTPYGECRSEHVWRHLKVGANNIVEDGSPIAWLYYGIDFDLFRKEHEGDFSTAQLEMPDEAVFILGVEESPDLIIRAKLGPNRSLEHLSTAILKPENLTFSSFARSDERCTKLLRLSEYPYILEGEYKE